MLMFHDYAHCLLKQSVGTVVRWTSVGVECAVPKGHSSAWLREKIPQEEV